MPTFDLVVLGCGGGPSEYNLSSYLLKASQNSWKDGVVALEAGSGIGALSRILETQPNLFGQYTTRGGQKRSYTAAEIMSWIRSYLVTHAHMDHISSLVLSAGSMRGPTRNIHAVHRTLTDIESVFSDRLWPNLASWTETEDSSLIYAQLHVDGQYASIGNGLSVRTLPLSHGQTRQDETYDSAAFFIKHDSSGNEFLFLGDVEPDSLSACPRNRDMWCAAAPKIPQTLSAIFIECSYPADRADHLLYGHLSPEHLVSELVTLAEEVVKVRRAAADSPSSANPPSTQRVRKKQRVNPVTPLERRNALAGVQVYIIHCKEDLDRKWDRPIQHVIADQVRKIAQDAELGVNIIAVEQGMTIHI